MGNITIASTTDTPEQVQQALGLTPETPADSNTTPETGDKGAASSESGAESGSAAEKDVKTGAAGTTPDVGDDADPIDNADDDDADDDGEPEPQAQAGQPAGKGKGGFQKRIERANRKIGTLESTLVQQTRTNLELQRQLNELNQKINTPPKPEPKKEPEVTTLRPQPVYDANKHGSYQEFLQDQGTWMKEALDHAKATSDKEYAAKLSDEVQKIQQGAQRTEQQRQAQARIAQVHAEFAQRQDKFVAELKAQNKDYHAIIKSAAESGVQISDEMRGVMLVHEKGPQLALWYAEHPAEVQRIAQLHPSLQHIELGQIIAGFKTVAPAAPKAKKSGAPKPIGKVGTGTASSTAKYTVAQMENMSLAEYRKARREMQTQS